MTGDSREAEGEVTTSPYSRTTTDYAPRQDPGPHHRTIALTVSPESASRFYPLLQAGFFIQAPVGGAVSAFLRESLMLSQPYIEERITTVLLDGQPVDDLDTALIMDGSTLALSSAMPGLVGATMRRKGYYASLRSTITYHGEVQEGETKVTEGMIRLKLFNIIMAEFGPGLLERGILFRSSDMADFFRSQDDAFFHGVLTGDVDGQHLDPSAMRTVHFGEYEYTEVKVCVSR